jgi:ribonuclease P/MRP protein subunit POP5
MKLLPALKQKKRYIVFEIVSSAKFSLKDIDKAVSESLLQFLGEFGVAKAAPMLIKEKIGSNKFILKVNHKYIDELKAAMMLTKKISATPVVIKSIITSGTLKKAGTYLK